MADLLANVTPIWEFVLQGISAICGVVVAQPLLLIGFSLMMIGFVVGICKRLISTF